MYRFTHTEAGTGKHAIYAKIYDNSGSQEGSDKYSMYRLSGRDILYTDEGRQTGTDCLSVLVCL